MTAGAVSHQGAKTMYDLDDVIRGTAFLGAVVGAVLIIGSALVLG